MSARSRWLPVADRRTWLSTLHVVGDLWIGIVTFTLIVTLLSLTAGLAITFVIAVPVAWLLIAVSRGLAAMERARARAFLGVDVRSPHDPVVGGWWSRLRQRFTSRATWREIAYHVVLLPAGAVGGSLAVGLWGGSLFLVVLPFAVSSLPDEIAHFGLFDLSAPESWLALPIGVVGLLWLAPWFAQGWAALDAGLVRSLLGRSATADLARRVETLSTTRALAVDAAEEERRRIERDLHDGAQQRLVALALDLGMAKSKLESDPDAAKELLDQAHDQARTAIAELRDLARGIHPVALTDRGLPGAIPGLASRAPFPVEVQVDVAERPVPAIEGIAYFLVSEALTNVAKHSGASKAWVSIVRRGDRLTVDITDDGAGGAEPSGGTGLRGLRDRVASVDGDFVVQSPHGGPTVIHADLPCTLDTARGGQGVSR